MKEAKKRAEAMAKPPAALNACKTQEKGTQKKGGKKQAKAIAKQKAQAALNAFETPQKRPKKQGGSVAKKAKVQGQPLLPVAPPVPKRCPAPAPSQRLGCSKCRRSVTGCLACCPLKHAAWKKRKQEAVNRRYKPVD